MNNIKTFENFNNQDIFTYIKNNDIQSVKNYIDYGHDLNVEYGYRYTPVIYAAYKNNKEIICYYDLRYEKEFYINNIEELCILVNDLGL